MPGSSGDDDADMESQPEESEVPDLTARWGVELEESVLCVALSAKERLLACGTAEDAIAVLDVDTGAVKFTLAGHHGGTTCLAWLGGNTLVSCGEDGCARVWSVARQACVHTLEVPGEGADRCGCVGGQGGGHALGARGGGPHEDERLCCAC